LGEGRAGAVTDIDCEEDGRGFFIGGIWGWVSSEGHVVPEEGAQGVVGGECFCCEFEVTEMFG
jgi:hypothetical protein